MSAAVPGLPAVFRFAPSPTGYLHLGHGFAALRAARAAEALGGRFLLRIEDIDSGRSRAAFVEAIFEDLTWLGLTWEEPVRRQSEHFADYQAALDRLVGRDLAYRCFCTRRDILREIEAAGGAPHGPAGPVYPGICRGLAPAQAAARAAAGEAFVWRLHLAAALASVDRADLLWQDQSAGLQQADPAPLGDVVLDRKETRFSYHLAVVVDDAAQAVSHVVRGADLFAATHVHVLLQRLLDLPTPHYDHHPLIHDRAGRRLAKRHASLGLRALRAAGWTGTALRAHIEARLYENIPAFPALL